VCELLELLSPLLFRSPEFNKKDDAGCLDGWRVGVLRRWHGRTYCLQSRFEWLSTHFDISINYDRRRAYCTVLHCS